MGTSRTGHAHVPSEVEPDSISDLVADGAAVQALLEERRTTPDVPGQRALAIPDRAVAVVAGLDRYGD